MIKFRIFFLAITLLLNYFVVSQNDIDKKYLLGKIQTTDSILKKIPREFCLYRDEFLHKDVVDSFVAMYKEALKDGIELKVVSAFRPFSQPIYGQKYLWELKFNNISKNLKTTDTLKIAKEVLKYSSMPGTSRHHWGTEVDLCTLEDSFFVNTEKGKKIYKWLQNNAHKFGFYQPYTAGRTGGYYEEKWHWSYIPLAAKYLEDYKKKVKFSDISGFLGDSKVKELDVIKNYVLNINPNLLEDKD